MEHIFNAAGAKTVKDQTLDRLLRQMRRIKTPAELREMNTAQEITDAAFSHILGKIREGVTERELALEIEFFMRRNGADIMRRKKRSGHEAGDGKGRRI